jgi:hypothetical protein
MKRAEEVEVSQRRRWGIQNKKWGRMNKREQLRERGGGGDRRWRWRSIWPLIGGRQVESWRKAEGVSMTVEPVESASIRR